jgi:hypothetical protein
MPPEPQQLEDIFSLPVWEVEWDEGEVFPLSSDHLEEYGSFALLSNKKSQNIFSMELSAHTHILTLTSDLNIFFTF